MSLVYACSLLLAPRAPAQTAPWQPAPGHTQMPLWSGTPPDPQPVRSPETAVTSTFKVGGRPVLAVSHVADPTLTLYAPEGSDPHPAVLVFPGGGYATLAIDLEGTEACAWLNSLDIACILLKYRVTNTGAFPRSGPYPESPMALEDAQRAMGLIRLHAAEWHIDPHKLGVLGFSAGGHLVAAISNHFDRRLYPTQDAADRESCRPDFALALYPGHLSRTAALYDATHYQKKFALPQPEPAAIPDPDLALNPDLHVSKSTPPTFLVQAEDDHTDSVYDALSYYIAVERAGVLAELHLYPLGGHGFGLRKTAKPITNWPTLAEQWLTAIGVLD